jgi:outer membrane protein OmpA-like peptidoglycan-associated protein
MYRVGITLGALLALGTTIVAREELARLLVREDSAAAIGATAPSASPKRLPRATAAAPSAADPSRSTFDVVQISPDGVSVFAGRAPPHGNVTILANGEPVASTKADATGAWATVTERAFAPAEYEFSLRARSGERDEVTEGQSVRIVLAPTGKEVLPSARAPASLQTSLPKPITFIYNDAVFTSEGQKAAEQLAQHLLAQRSQAVSLSGHADERGTERYNLELSRQRLNAVADFLRTRGYAGRLDLMPKGKSEPFADADRRALSREDAYQLDRRVQIRSLR